MSATPAGILSAPRSTNTGALLAGLVVLAVLLIGGGLAAVLMLTTDRAAAGTAGSAGPGGGAVVAPVSAEGPEGAAGGPTIDRPGGGTGDQANDANPPQAPGGAAQTTREPAPGGGSEPPASGDLDTAVSVAERYVDLVNQADYAAASNLVCAAQRDEFINGWGGAPPRFTIAIDDIWQDGEKVLFVIYGEEDPHGTGFELTMLPTDTGSFLICDAPLGAEDLAS